MTKITGIWRRGNVYQYRVRVPSDIRCVLNREFINRSLKTNHYENAVRAARTVAFNIENIFDQARLGDTISAQKLLHKSVTHRPTTQGKIKEQIRGSTSTRTPTGNIDEIVEKVAAKVLKSMGHSVSFGPAISIKELYKRYMNDPMMVRSNKSQIEYNAVFGILTEVIGPNTPITDINRAVCRETMEVIRYLPPHARRRFPDRSWTEICEISRKKKLKRLSASTINKYLLNLSALLNWAVKEELLLRNPAKGLQIAEDVRAKDKRLPFSDEQLAIMFNDPVFTKRAYKNWPSRFWIPYIALYSGMRLNEICQMNAEDVREFEAVLCFHVTTEVIDGPDNKNVKTSASERVIPVHPKLLTLGFEDYLSSISRNGKLFPDLRMITGSYPSHSFSKYFPKFLTRCGGKRPRTSFHSFRHNFRDALRNAGVPHDVALALGGWTGNRGVEASYGRGYSTNVLAKGINEIRYSPIDALLSIYQ